MYGDRTLYLKCPENNALSPKELGEENRKKKQAYWGWETARLGSIREVSELAALQPSSNVTGTQRSVILPAIRKADGLEANFQTANNRSVSKAHAAEIQPNVRTNSGREYKRLL